MSVTDITQGEHSENAFTPIGRTSVEGSSNNRLDASPEIRIWHGRHQCIGQRGSAQDDFNLMGDVTHRQSLASLKYQVNGQPFRDLTVGASGRDGRRLAMEGHFNADIPVADLKLGTNTIKLQACDNAGSLNESTVSLEKSHGQYLLPTQIRWNDVANPQDIGQYVDGEWFQDGNGLRTKHSGYDRLFLIGDRTWQDYEVTVPMTIHRVDSKTSAVSGGNGLGLIMRFAGHAVGGHRNFPASQPKWGYQPFGAIAWLRWQEGRPDLAPTKQFYPGYSDGHLNRGELPIELGRTYCVKTRCESLSRVPKRWIFGRKHCVVQERKCTVFDAGRRVTRPITNEGKSGITRYSFKIWRAETREPARWDWEVVQSSVNALRSGGFAFVAHHVDATFGDTEVVAVGIDKFVK